MRYFFKATGVLVVAVLGFCFWKFPELGLGISAMAVAWLSFCVKIVGPTEKAISVFLGKPWRNLNSGLNFILWPMEKLVVYPTKQQELELEPIEVVTKKDISHSQAAIKVKLTFYFFWPDNLTSALVKGASPDTIKGLFQEAIYNALRSVIIGMTWETCYSEKDKIGKEALDILFDTSSPIKEAGIEKNKIFTAIEVFLPKELIANLTAPEVAGLKADARKKEAVGEKEFILAQKQAEAEGRKLVFDSIGDNMAKEALFTLREMSQGTSNTILFGLPPELYETVKNATRNTDIEKAFKLLPVKQQKQTLEFMEKLKLKGGEK